MNSRAAVRLCIAVSRAENGTDRPTRAARAAAAATETFVLFPPCAVAAAVPDTVAGSRAAAVIAGPAAAGPSRRTRASGVLVAVAAAVNRYDILHRGRAARRVLCAARTYRDRKSPTDNSRE
jgi:hypothetical protein